MWFLSAGHASLFFPKGSHNVSTFLSQNRQDLFLLRYLIVFYEQASRRTP